MSAQPKHALSVAEYLAFERGQQDKHEYVDGDIYLQAGASVAHNLICANIIAGLRPQLRGSSCRIYPSDIRIKIPQRRHYVYADVSIICGTTMLDDVDPETVRNPKVIIEVLSPSTENYDRGRKFQAYRRIPDLEEYLLVAQESIRVEHFVRQTRTIWTMTEYTDLIATIDLPSIHVALPVRTIYEELELSEESDSEPINT
jgi:Uma2 family endonuclease